ELAQRRDLRGNAAVAGRGQCRVVGRAAGLGGGALGVGGVVDGRPVLGANVGPLAHALGRVVVLPEDLEELAVGDGGGVVDGEDDLGVPGAPGAHLLVGGVGGVAAGVADCGGVDARELPEQPLGAPEAAHAEHGGGHALRERGNDRSGQVYEVPLRNHGGGGATGQRLIGSHHGRHLLTAEQHDTNEGNRERGAWV